MHRKVRVELTQRAGPPRARRRERRIRRRAGAAGTKGKGPLAQATLRLSRLARHLSRAEPEEGGRKVRSPAGTAPGASKILPCLARSYFAGGLRAAGKTMEVAQEFAEIFAEGSEYAPWTVMFVGGEAASGPLLRVASEMRTEQEYIVCDENDLSKMVKVTPRSAWLFPCAVAALLQRQPSAGLARIAINRPTLHRLIERIAEAPTTREPFRFWLLAAYAAAWRGELEKTEQLLKHVALPADPHQKESTLSVMLAVRSVARALTDVAGPDCYPSRRSFTSSPLSLTLSPLGRGKECSQLPSTSGIGPA